MVILAIMPLILLDDCHSGAHRSSRWSSCGTGRATESTPFWRGITAGSNTYLPCGLTAMSFRWSLPKDRFGYNGLPFAPARRIPR